MFSKKDGYSSFNAFIALVRSFVPLAAFVAASYKSLSFVNWLCASFSAFFKASLYAVNASLSTSMFSFALNNPFTQSASSLP